MPPANILIVEDQNIVARDLQSRLCNLGYSVSAVVASGEEAISQTRSLQPNLVLMDIQLKGELDGIQVGEQILVETDVPIVYLTAYSDEHTLRRATITNPYGYVIKPFGDQELRTTIDLALHKHQLERKVRESEARFRTLVENSSDVIVVVNANGNVTYNSPAADRLFEPSAMRSIDDLLMRYIHPEDLPELFETWRDIQTQPGAKRTFPECRVRGKDGLWHALSVVATNLLGDPAVNGIVINAHDITLQREAREMLERLFITEQRHARELAALHTAFRTMAASLELKQVLASTIAELKRLIDAEGASVLLRTGRELEFAAGSGPGTDVLLGQRIPIESGIAGATLNSKTATLVTNAQTDRRFFNSIDRRTGLTTRSLIAVPLIVNATAIGVMEAINKSTGEFDAHDLDLMQAMASSAAVAIENARMYEAVREYNRRLQAAQPQLIQTEKMAALGRLTASMAHEINNPLQVVQGCLSLVQDALDGHDPIDLPTCDAMQQDLSTAMHEVERLAALVQHLHHFYQPIRTPTKSSDVHDLIARVLELTEHQIVANHIAVKLVLELERVRPRPWVAANPDHLMQALLNLILGAIDSMPDGGQLAIRTALDAHLSPAGVSAESRICIDISDTGATIPAAALPYVFEPFHAVRPNDSGLSLSICYELITSLGGEITVTSQAGLGTTFTLWLPIEPSD